MACKCESDIEPGTSADLPCPACWDAFRTGQALERDGQRWEVTTRVENLGSSTFRVWYGWRPISATGEHR